MLVTARSMIGRQGRLVSLRSVVSSCTTRSFATAPSPPKPTASATATVAKATVTPPVVGTASKPTTAASRAQEKRRPRLYGPTGNSATEIFENAKAENSLAKVGEELHRFVKALDDDPELSMNLMSPLMHGEQFEPMLNEIFQELNITTTQAQTLILEQVMARGLHKLKRILVDFDMLSQWDRSEVTATVTTANKLTPEQLKRLTDALQKHVEPGIKLLIKQEVEPDLLGGLKVEMENSSVDLSVATRLAEVSQEMKG